MQVEYLTIEVSIVKVRVSNGKEWDPECYNGIMWEGLEESSNIKLIILLSSLLLEAISSPLVVVTSTSRVLFPLHLSVRRLTLLCLKKVSFL